MDRGDWWVAGGGDQLTEPVKICQPPALVLVTCLSAMEPSVVCSIASMILDREQVKVLCMRPYNTYPHHNPHTPPYVLLQRCHGS